MADQISLFTPLTLPCGVTLKNRIVKSAMSDSLGDGTGHPTPDQMRLYEIWADGGLAASIIGEVQGSPRYAEKPGNLVLDGAADLDRFRALAARGGHWRGADPRRAWFPAKPVPVPAVQSAQRQLWR